MKKFLLSSAIIISCCFFAEADKVSKELKSKMEDLIPKIEYVISPSIKDKDLLASQLTQEKSLFYFKVAAKKTAEEQFLYNLYFYLYLNAIKNLSYQQIDQLLGNGEIEFQKDYVIKNKQKIIDIYQKFKNNTYELSYNNKKEILQLSIKLKQKETTQNAGSLPPPPGGLPPPLKAGLALAEPQTPLWGNIKNDNIFDLSEIKDLFVELDKNYFNLKLRSEASVMKNLLEQLIIENINSSMNINLESLKGSLLDSFYGFMDLVKQKCLQKGEKTEDLSHIKPDARGIASFLKVLLNKDLDNNVIKLLEDLVNKSKKFVETFFDTILKNRKQYLHTMSLIIKTCTKELFDENSQKNITERIKQLTQEKITSDAIQKYEKFSKQVITEEKALKIQEKVKDFLNHLKMNDYQEKQDDISFTEEELEIIRKKYRLKTLTQALASFDGILAKINTEQPHTKKDDIATIEEDEVRQNKLNEENLLINDISSLLTQEIESEGMSIAQFLIKLYHQKNNEFNTEKGKMEDEKAKEVIDFLEQLVNIKVDNNTPLFDIENWKQNKENYEKVYEYLTIIVYVECLPLFCKEENLKPNVSTNIMSTFMTSAHYVPENYTLTLGTTQGHIKNSINENANIYCKLISKLFTYFGSHKKTNNNRKSKDDEKLNEREKNEEINKYILQLYEVKTPTEQIMKYKKNIKTPVRIENAFTDISERIIISQKEVNGLKEILRLNEIKKKQPVKKEIKKKQPVNSQDQSQTQPATNDGDASVNGLNTTITDLNSKATEIDQLQKEIAALRTVNDELSKQITTLSAQNHQLKGDKERLNKQTENLAAEKDEAQKEITALRAQNERLMQNEDMGLQDLFDEEKAQLQGQIADLQNMNKQLTEANKDLQAEKTKLETQVKNLTSGKEKAIDGLKNDRNARVNDLNATIADLEHQVKTKAAEIARLQKENNDLRIEKVGNTEKTKQLIGGHIADVITNQLTEQHEANVSSLNLTYLSDIKRKDDEIRDLKEENTDMKNQMELHGIKYVGRGSSTVVREDEEAKDTRQQLEVTVKHQSEVIMRNEAELKKNAETIKKLEIIVNKYRNELDEIKNKNESEDDKNLLDMIEEKQKMMESLQKELEDKETLQNKKQAELDAREKQLNQREKGISSKNGRNSRLMLQKLKSMPHKNNVESSNKDVETQVATAA